VHASFYNLSVRKSSTINMSKRMRKNINFLTSLKTSSPAERKKLLAKSGSKEISTIAEISKNLLHNKFPLSGKQKGRLCKYKKMLRRLASRKVNFRKKKSEIQKGGFMSALPLIIGTIAPIIANLITRKKGKSIKGGRRKRRKRRSRRRRRK
jgi:hypothetical protein